MKLPDPLWITIAKKYNGLAEIKGPQHNPHIVKWFGQIGTSVRDDETPWCGAFVGGVLLEAGYPIVPGAAMARNWLKLKTKLDQMAYGAVCVLWRGDREGPSGHVGFVVGRDGNNPVLLSANVSDKTQVKPFPADRVLGYRWPGLYPYPERFNVPTVKAGSFSTNEA